MNFEVVSENNSHKLLKSFDNSTLTDLYLKLGSLIDQYDPNVCKDHTRIVVLQNLINKLTLIFETR